jgi:hypothetical protein
VIALKLSHDEPKLVYLALVYHLGRPGSEIDPATHASLDHGLREVKLRLGNELELPAPVIELDDWQYARLLSAIKGCVTELRVYHMREGATSTVARWTETAETLFPELKHDRDVALDLAESMMMLQRRIQRAVNAAGDA